MNDKAAIAILDRPDPPTGGPPLLLAVWYALGGQWREAHEIAQGDGSTLGAWVHAWLHRIEGDLGNAGYWYRRAGRPAFGGPTEAEAREIASALLSGGAAQGGKPPSDA